MNAIHRFGFLYTAILAVLSGSCCFGNENIYVGDPINDLLSVIDSSSNTVITTLSVGDSPTSIVFAPSGNPAYVSISSDMQISILDTTENTIVGTIALTGTPLSLGILPGGSKIYASLAEGAVIAIDPVSFNVLATISVQSNPANMAFLPDGTKLYVVRNQNSTFNVSVIDTVSDVLLTTITVDERPGAITMDPDGTKAYVSFIGNGGAGNTVNIINTATDTVATVITLGVAPQSLQGIDITPDGSTLYVVADFPDLVYAVDTDTNAVIATIMVGLNPTSAAVNADGSLVYITNSAGPGVSGGSMSVIETEGNTIIATVTLLRPFAIGVCPIPQFRVGGETRTNLFLTQIEYFNRLSWSPFEGSVDEYAIFRGENKDELIGIVPSTQPLVFDDHNRKKGESIVYTVSARLGSATLSEATTRVVVE